MKSTIMLNPKLSFAKRSSGKIEVLLDRKKIVLSGEKIAKYFIPYVELLTSPIELDSFFEILTKRNELAVEEWSEVEKVLIKNKILLLKTFEERTILTHKKVLIVDFTNLQQAVYLQGVLKRIAEENRIDIDIQSLNYNELPVSEFLSDNEVDILIPIFWSWASTYEEIITNSLKRINIVVPVISNNNYFSIGPKINDEMSKVEAIFNLEIERSRYEYEHHEVNRITFMLMSSLVSIEIIEIINNQLNSGINRVKIQKQIVTYNYNSFKLKLNRRKMI
jgi:hypothetical protein